MDVVTISINQTLSRTLMTSSTPLLALLSPPSLGGEVIPAFPLALPVGALIATYPSIYVATPKALQLGISRGDPMWPEKESAELARP